MLCKIINGDEIPDEIEIWTIEEFENTLAQFTTYPPSNESAISVELPSGMLSLNLSCPNTFLNYVGYDEFKQFTDGLIGVGDLSDESGQVMNCYWDNFGERWVRELKRHLISQKQARRALQYFVQTGGQLTDEITWEEPTIWYNRYLAIYDLIDDFIPNDISTHNKTTSEKCLPNEEAQVLIQLLETKIGPLENPVKMYIERMELQQIHLFIRLVKRLDEK
jgi:hypothetical protein